MATGLCQFPWCQWDCVGVPDPDIWIFSVKIHSQDKKCQGTNEISIAVGRIWGGVVQESLFIICKNDVVKISKASGKKRVCANNGF